MNRALKIRVGVGSLLGVLLIAGGILWKRSHTAAVAKIANKADAPAVVALQEIQQAELSDLLSFPARTQPVATSPLLSEIDGVVMKVTQPIGNAVRAGQTVLTIKNTDPVYNFEPVQVTSPIRGVVSQIDVTPGAIVSRGQRLGLVADTSRVRIQVEVPAADLSRMEEGMLGEFQWGSSATQIQKVRVLGVSPFVDPATGTATADLELLKSKDKSARIFPGVIGQVRLKVGSHQGIEIPAEAISYNGDQPYVVVVDPKDRKASNRDIKLGKKAMGKVEVLDGLKASDQVAKRTSKFIAPGDVVEIEQVTAASTGEPKADAKSDKIKTSKAAAAKK